MDFLWFLPYIITALVSFSAGIYAGIKILRKTWLEPGFKMGFIQDGEDAYSLTRKRGYSKTKRF